MLVANEDKDGEKRCDIARNYDRMSMGQAGVEARSENEESIF